MSDVILASAITAAASILCQMMVSARTQSLIAYRVGELERKVDKLYLVLENSQSSSGGTHAGGGDGGIPHLPHFAQGAGSIL